jgi:fumarylacetoacetase
MAPLRSWLAIAPDSPFSLSNIPFGIITTADDPSPRAATAVGEHALDLRALLLLGSPAYARLAAERPGALDDDDLLVVRHAAAFGAPTLNALAALGPRVRAAARRHVRRLLAADAPLAAVLRDADDAAWRARVLRPLAEVAVRLPFAVGDYTDFYAGVHHAANCGRLLRGVGNELQPNYRRVPVAYHGRASSVVVSGTDVVRPAGQVVSVPAAPAENREAQVVLAPCRRLDFELELGCFVALPNALGEPVAVESAADRLFGVVLLNDWSARDVQAWEMVPLGPFNAKNFATTVSPWVVTMEALEPFLVPALESERELLPYLGGAGVRRVFDIRLKVDIESKILAF